MAVYESLYFLNRNVEELIVILDLEEIKNAPGMPKKVFDAYKVEIQYLRSHATQDILEAMNDTEIHEMARLGKQKKAYDDSICDLDDVYFEVQKREEQRRKQGLPSLIGVLRGYPAPTSEQEQSDVELSLEPGSRVVQSRHRSESASETLQQNKSMPKTRTRRRSWRAS